MKNKKLFAILTLVCFMFTLMPVAAFAALDDKYVQFADGGSYVDYKSVVAGTPVSAVVTDDSNALDGDSYIHFVETKDGAPVYVTTTGTLAFNAAATYYVYAIKADANTLAIYNNPTNDYADMIDAFYNSRYKANIVENYAVLKVTAGTDVYDINLTAVAGAADLTEVEAGKWTMSMDADNGFTPVKLQAKVTANSNNAKDAKVTYSSNGVKVVNADATTDNRGRAEFGLVATNSGTYTVKVSCGDATETITITVAQDGASQIATTATPKAPVDVNTEIEDTGISFKVTDVNGNAITTGVNSLSNGVEYAVVVDEQPADSDFDGTEFALKFDATYKYVELDGPALAEEGDYTFTVKMKNGNSATASVKVQEFDEDAITGLVIAYASNTIALGEDAALAKVFLMDKDGVQRNLMTGTYADMGNVDLAANGKAVAGFAAATGAGYGVVTADTEEDYIGSKIDVFAVYGDYTASATLTVVEPAAGLQFTVTNAEVGVNSTIVANIVDAEGNKVALGAGYTVDAGYPKVIVLDKPENAVAAANNVLINSQNNGLSFNFVASTAGEYKVQVVVKYTDGTAKYLSEVATITVGAQEGTFKDVVVVSLAADSMIVNNEVVKLDVAPFIENNRTMMQFNVLYVFGIDVQWDGVDTITAEGNGVKVVMKLGSKVAVVNGEEVALDVAPYSVNGRTVVPVGFITGILDIVPTFTYNADGTIADILFTK